MSNSSNLTVNQTIVAYVNDLNNQVTYYFSVVSSAIGLPTNIFSAWIFIIIMKKNKTSMGFLCLIQSIVDFFYLLLLLLVLRPTPLLFAQNFYNSSDLSCKILMFMRRFIAHASCVVTLVITFDRLIAVCCSSQAFSKFMKRKSVLLGLILGFFLFMALVDIPNLFFYLSSNGKNQICTADPNIIISADLIAILLRTYIPFVIMAIMNFFIIRKMKKSSRVSLKQTNQSRKENHFTNAVIAYDGFFLICSLPISVFFIIYDFYLISGAFKADPVLGAVYNFWFNIFLNISYGKQFLTFFMNVFFNKVFWYETKLFFSKNSIVASSPLRQTTIIQ